MLFGGMLGIHVAKPVNLFASQWESSTRFEFTAPGTPQLLRVEKESSPGAEDWSAFGTINAGASTTSGDLSGYTEGGSYRARWERQGVVSEWVAVTTPDEAVSPPDEPASVSYACISGETLQGGVTPSEPNTAVRYQFLDNLGNVLAEGTDTSDGSLSAMGPYFHSAPCGGTQGFRARHERFSGTGVWASDYVTVTGP